MLEVATRIATFVTSSDKRAPATPVRFQRISHGPTTIGQLVAVVVTEGRTDTATPSTSADRMCPTPTSKPPRPLEQLGNDRQPTLTTSGKHRRGWPRHLGLSSD